MVPALILWLIVTIALVWFLTVPPVHIWVKVVIGYALALSLYYNGGVPPCFKKRTCP